MRKSAGLTQAQLAALVAVETETISRYERGERALSLERIEQLAVALDSDLDDFLAGVLRTPPSATDEMAAIVDLLNGLPSGQLEVIHRLIQVHLTGRHG